MPATWGRAILGGGLLWLASRLVVTAVAILSRWAASGQPLGGQPFERLLFAWDSIHFDQIASGGYFVGPDAPELPAFFPGYPVASALTAKALVFTRDPVAWGMFAVAALAGLAASILLWRLAEDEGGVDVAFTAAAMFLFSPYAVFLHASYSEPLFLAFAIGAWYAATKGAWWIAGLLAAGASFTRPNGLFLVAALVIMYLVIARRAGRPLIRWTALGPLLGGLGAGGYVLWLWARTGSLTTWQQAQEAGWYRRTTWPWDSFDATVRMMLHHSHLDARPQFGLDIVFGFATLLAIVWLAIKRSWPTVVYAGLTVAAMATSTSWVSLARNTLTLFPLTVAIAATCTRGRWRRRTLLVVMASSVALLAFNTHQFTLFQWAD
ncbi:MAG: mannosyltransferase family protein [Propionibacterium sp.]|nr:mannosyltransferase family protein [Propionibacterium sp.]